MEIIINGLFEQLKFYASLEFGRFLGIINFASFIVAILIVKSSRLTRIIGWGLHILLMSLLGLFWKDKFIKKSLPDYPSSMGGPHEMLYFFGSLVICVLILAVTFNKQGA